MEKTNDLWYFEGDDMDNILNEIKDHPYMKALNEGLIKTYPIEMVKDILSREFGFDERNFQVRTTINFTVIPRLLIKIPNVMSKEVAGNVKHRMESCGYFLCKRPQFMASGIVYQFEPKFSTDITNELASGKLYHMTDKIYLKKIMKYGLTPRSKNSLYSYPDRIYLMCYIDNQVINQLSNVQKARERNIIQGQNPEEKNEYVLLTIDTNRLSDNVRFYADPMSRGVFTYNNIPPSAIVNIQPFNTTENL